MTPALTPGMTPGTTTDAGDLAALVSARLCHDLISPIGAVGNGLELLELEAERPSPELALVSDSLATALAKLRFFRIAFGPADPAAATSRDEAGQICSAMFGGRFAVAWDAAGDLPRPAARLACLAILCIERSLPMGGTVELTTPAPDAIALRAVARRTAPPADLWAHVEDQTPLARLRPDSVQFALLARGLAETGATLAARFGETSADVRIAIPAAALTPPPAEVRP